MMPQLATTYSDTTFDTLKQRAAVYAKIRQFLNERNILEVETPLLSQAATTDIHLASVQANIHINGQLKSYYLHTSPEFAMKRLISQFKQPIFQICKVFRDYEIGRRHNIEFTMLEWYQPHSTLPALMQQVTELLSFVFNRPLQPVVLTYKQAFLNRLDINPLTADMSTLRKTARRIGLSTELGTDRLAWLDLLFSHIIEPTLGYNAPTYLIDFPAEMASLARTQPNAEGEPVAARFELYINGLELANAYDELTDPDELRRRFNEDNCDRQAQHLPIMPIDEHLLDALNDFLPCVGIALGLDRLIMLVTQSTRIAQVISFSTLTA